LYKENQTLVLDVGQFTQEWDATVSYGILMISCSKLQSLAN